MCLRTWTAPDSLPTHDAMHCRAVICIGAGEDEEETREIHRAAADLAEKGGEALIIPTPCSAHSPDAVQVAWFRRLYGKMLGFRVTAIEFGSGAALAPKKAKSKVEQASLIFIPGGNTLSMLNRWRRSGIDVLLSAAFRTQAHTLFVGSSAGSIYPFRKGVTSCTSAEDCENGLVDGLGWFRGIVCPHLGEREKDFRRHLQSLPEDAVGIGISGCTALIRSRDDCTIIGRRSVKLFSREGGRLHAEELRGTFPIGGDLERAVGVSEHTEEHAA